LEVPNKEVYIRQQKPSCDHKHGTLEGNLVSTIGDAAGLPVFAKEDTTAQAVSPHNAKETNQEDFRQAGAS